MISRTEMKLRISKQSLNRYILIGHSIIVFLSFFIFVCTAHFVYAQDDVTDPIATTPPTDIEADSDLLIPHSDEALQSASSLLIAAASDGHFWYIPKRHETDSGQFRIVHHGTGMNKGIIEDAVSISGKPEALAAVDNTLYAIFPSTKSKDGSLSRLIGVSRVFYDSTQRKWFYYPSDRLKLMSSLPDGGSVANAIVFDQSLYVLLNNRGTSPIIAFNKPGDNLAQVSTTEDEDQTASDSNPPSGYKLWRLKQNTWEEIALPDSSNYAQIDSIKLIQSDSPMAIVTSISTLNATSVSHIYQINSDDDKTWSSIFTLPIHASEVIDSIRIRNQTVLMLNRNQDNHIRLVYVRDSGLHSITEFDDLRDCQRMQLVKIDHKLGLLQQQSGLQPVTLEMINFLTGEVSEPIVLGRLTGLRNEDFTPLVLIGSFLTAILVMFLFRPDPTAYQVVLPDGAKIADPRIRLSAILIDLLPAAILTMFLLRVDASELFRWPLFGRVIGESTPALLMIVLCVLHTTISELIISTTLGKALMGCRVVSISGERPKFSQIIVRNIMKWIALIVPPLALFVLLNPYRQRLGDLAARTVVVAKYETSD